MPRSPEIFRFGVNVEAAKLFSVAEIGMVLGRYWGISEVHLLPQLVCGQPRGIDLRMFPNNESPGSHYSEKNTAGPGCKSFQSSQTEASQVMKIHVFFFFDFLKQRMWLYFHFRCLFWMLSWWSRGTTRHPFHAKGTYCPENNCAGLFLGPESTGKGERYLVVVKCGWVTGSSSA